jgi:hypothetical protein
MLSSPVLSLLTPVETSLPVAGHRIRTVMSAPYVLLLGPGIILKKSSFNPQSGPPPPVLVLSPRFSFFSNHSRRPGMASRRHLVAVNRQIAASGSAGRSEYAALVDLARKLARRMDSVGDDAPMSLLNAYQSVVGRLQRAAAQAAPVRVGREGGEQRPVRSSVGVLEAFMRKWHVRSEDRGEA